VRSLEFVGARRRFDGYVTLGCVIRGETSHYDYVCGETARALQDLAVKYCLALGFGLLTVENREQAEERAGVDRRDKGGEAARVCLSMIELKRAIGLFPR
jgi:6,7-dimethyl-8-ribityllumazine synthase